MKVISIIEDEDVIKKILKHLGLWPFESLSLDLEALDRKVEREKKARPPPKTRADPMRTDTLIDDSFSQLPMPARRLCGGSDKSLYVDPESPEACPPLA
jgi:hypothetical protein